MKWGTPDYTNGPYKDDDEDDWDSDDGLKTLYEKVAASVGDVADLASSFLVARGELRTLDYIAFAIRGSSTCIELWNRWMPQGPSPAADLAKYFVHPGTPWKLASYYACSTAFDNIEIREQIVESHVERQKGKIHQAVWTAVIDGVEIGWISSPKCDKVPSRIWSKTPEKIKEIAASRLWDKCGEDKIVRFAGTTVRPCELPTNLIDTQSSLSVEARARKFLERSVPRAMVLDGQPGTGKSSLVGILARKLGFKTIIFGADDLLSTHRHGYEDIRGTELAEMMKPDVLIVNDIDRLREDSQLILLDVLDTAKAYAKLIFATTNHYRNLLEPVRRPGRLDDVIHVPGLGVEEILLIAPDMAPLAEKMVGWPISYVKDMQNRYNVLGDLAYEEFDEVAKRLREIQEDGKYEADSEEDEDADDEAPYDDL